MGVGGRDRRTRCGTPLSPDSDATDGARERVDAARCGEAGPRGPIRVAAGVEAPGEARSPAVDARDGGLVRSIERLDGWPLSGGSGARELLERACAEECGET
jgi:hypothetical protein